MLASAFAPVELAGGGLGVLELEPIEILRFTQGRLPGAICLVILRILGENGLGARVQPQILHRLRQMFLERGELGLAFLPAGGDGSDRPGHPRGREARDSWAPGAEGQGSSRSDMAAD